MDFETLMSYEHPIHAEIILGYVAVKNHKPYHNDVLKEIPGHKFVGSGKDYWRFPLTWTTLVCLSRSFPNMTLSPDLHEWVNLKWNHIEMVTRLRTGEGEEVVDDELLHQIATLIPEVRSPVGKTQRRYQVSGALLLASAERFILLDEQGTGKMTEAALTFHMYPDTLPALIVSPASTLYTWQRELEVCGLDSTVLDGEMAKRRRALDKFDPDSKGIMICSYNMLPKHSRVAGYGAVQLSDDHKTPKELNQIEWATVCADEIHRAKSPKAVQTRALWAVSEGVRFRWGMTGTPIEGSPLDFWAILHFVDPEAWPSSVSFRDRWVDFYPNIWGGFEIRGIRADRADEWKAVSEHYWRRKKLEGMPATTEEVRYCELKGKHLKAYKDMAKQLMAETGEDDVVLFAQNHMVKAGRLKQLAQSYIETKVTVNDEGEEEIEVIPIEPSPKLDLLMDTLPDEEGVPMLIWFDSVKFMRLAQARLDAAGYKYEVIEGSMSAEERDRAVQSFQGGDVDMILLSISAAYEGITLTRAPLAIDVERSWSLLKEDQRRNRNLRIGSEIHDEIRTIVLMTKDTIEEDQYNDLAAKRETRDEVISPLSVS